MDGTKEKIQILKAMVSNPKDFDYTGDPELDTQWDTDDWKDHFYGSGDPAELDEQFVSNLAKYCFRAISSLTDIVSDLHESVKCQEDQEIRKAFVGNPEIIELVGMARELDDENLQLVTELACRLSRK